MVYHGTGNEIESFDRNRIKLGLGFFFTKKKSVAKGYADRYVGRGKGNVLSVYLNIRNPIRLETEAGRRVNEEIKAVMPADARGDAYKEAFVREAQSRGYDGMTMLEGVEYVAFSPEQIKSATSNQGTFDANNPDIRYSVSKEDVEQADEDLGQYMREGAERFPEKIDIYSTTPLFKTAEYTLSKIAAGRRALDAVARRQERRFMLQAEILDGVTAGMNQVERNYANENGFIKSFKKLKKNKKSYERVKRYLLLVDRTGRGFHMSSEHGYIVTTPDGDFVGVAKTEGQALAMARDHAESTGQKMSVERYGREKGLLWKAHKPDRSEIGTYTEEQDATRAMIDGEHALLLQKGFSKDEAEGVKSFREMTSRAFDKHIEGAREVIRRCEEMKIAPPMVESIDETRRWAVRGKDGKNIATFESKEKAEEILRQLSETHQNYANAKVERQDDSQVKRMVGLEYAIAQMGDMRGTYFPRQRESGGVGLWAVNEKTDEKIFIKGDLYIADLNPEEREGFISKSADALRRAINSATPLGLKARNLRNRGFKVKFERDTSMPEDVFAAGHLTSSIAAMMDESMERAGKSDMTEAQIAAFREIHKAVTMQIAGIIKQRGFLSSRMKRSGNYWQGFETDPLQAGVSYANGLAGGIAKRQLSKELTMIITGRDVSWKQWKKDNKGGDWTGYTKFVNDRKIDPIKQKNLYGETISWAEEVLRNKEASDRIMGTLKGLAVFKYLAFRVPSAFVNLSSLAITVPATISSHTGLGIARTTAQINRSLAALLDYKRGKASRLDVQIFTEISERGWDNPQFNHDAANVLRSKAGKAWQGVIDKGMWAFGQAEIINRRSTIHAAYKMWAKANPKLSHAELMEKAHFASDRAHGWYDVATAPKWTRGAANPAKMMWTFQKYGQNFMLNMGEMVGKGDYKQAAYMLLAPVILGGPKATLITPILAIIAKGMGIGGDDPEEEFYKWARDTFGTDAWMRFGLPGLVGVSFQGSLAMGIPVISDTVDKLKNAGSWAEVFGAPGSVVYDTYAAAKHAMKGEWLKATEKLLPSAIGSVAKAVRESTEGVTTEGYGSIYYGAEPLKISGVDRYLRALSFAPADITAKRQQQWSELKIKKKYDERRKDIYARIRHAYVQNDGYVPYDDMASFSPEIDKYNDAVRNSMRPDIPLIDGNSIEQMLKNNARPSRLERSRSM